VKISLFGGIFCGLINKKKKDLFLIPEFLIIFKTKTISNLKEKYYLVELEISKFKNNLSDGHL